MESMTKKELVVCLLVGVAVAIIIHYVLGLYGGMSEERWIRL